MRQISYVQALNEALHQLIAGDENVFLIGQGVNSPWYAGNSTVGLVERFGEGRVIDTPISENCVAGTAIGAALTGMRPILFHARMDFMYLAMDQLANNAASWHYMYGGNLNVPLTIWGVINRGGEQGAQHSQAIHAMLAHIPGLKVVMPATPYDAKGLLISSVADSNPVVYVDERWLYAHQGDVPEEMYTVPIGKGAVRREGKDVTVVATSYMVIEALKAAEILEKESIDVEVIDLRTLKPLDESLVIGSVKKTRRLVVADSGWKSFGAGAEVITRVMEHDDFRFSRAVPVARVSLPDIPAPASRALEKQYYPDAISIATAVRKVIGDNYSSSKLEMLLPWHMGFPVEEG
ncbi:MAG: pyruvate dehydrogenase complex E1 component subunit beta [Dehalococcoidales bacterium]|nr:pyruvate dehydrogenase complex E1 component subunit beta [Dehalococcoidales bacterium]